MSDKVSRIFEKKHFSLYSLILIINFEVSDEEILLTHGSPSLWMLSSWSRRTSTASTYSSLIAWRRASFVSTLNIQRCIVNNFLPECPPCFPTIAPPSQGSHCQWPWARQCGRGDQRSRCWLCFRCSRASWLSNDHYFHHNYGFCSTFELMQHLPSQQQEETSSLRMKGHLNPSNWEVDPSVRLSQISLSLKILPVRFNYKCYLRSNTTMNQLNRIILDVPSRKTTKTWTFARVSTCLSLS